jgi:hypothetical protein
MLPDLTAGLNQDPNGKTLLSTDAVANRRLHVSSSGVIDAYSGSGGPLHPTGIDQDHPELGAITIRLANATCSTDYLDTPNGGGVYKVWVTPAADFVGDPTLVDNICGNGCFHGFVPSKSKTDSFKVVPTTATFCLKVVKQLANGDGTFSPGFGTRCYPLRLLLSSVNRQSISSCLSIAANSGPPPSGSLLPAGSWPEWPWRDCGPKHRLQRSPRTSGSDWQPPPLTRGDEGRFWSALRGGLAAYPATSAAPRRIKCGACLATSAKNAPGSSGARRISESRPMRTATRLPSMGPRELSPTKVMAVYGIAQRVSPARTRKASGAVTYSWGRAISNRTSSTGPPIQRLPPAARTPTTYRMAANSHTSTFDLCLICLFVKGGRVTYPARCYLSVTRCVCS